MNKLKLIFIIFGCLSVGIIIGNAITGNDAIVEKQQQLIEMQNVALDSLTNHLWFEHDCELGICDSYLLDSITTLDTELKKLYNK
jgi:hypothetical protein